MADKSAPAEKRMARFAKHLHVRSSYWALYSLLSDAESQCILLVGFLCAIAAGVPLPLIAVVFRNIIEEFPPDENQVNSAIHYILGISSAYFALTWTWTVCWGIIGGRISRRLQERLVERIVSLDMEYFDTEPLDLTSILTADTQTIQRGTSEKVGLFVQSISYFISTFITGFVLSPALTGVLLAAILPALLLLVTVGSTLVSRFSKRANKLSEAAAISAEQAIRAVQVVQAYGAIDLLCDEHARILRQASHAAFRKSISAGVMLGLIYFVCYAVNALAFFWGTRIGGSSGTIYAVVFLILDASFVINQVGPFIQTISMASLSGEKILQLINHKAPKIDPCADTGYILEQLGDIECNDVSFSYPARPAKEVLSSISLTFRAGSSTGIVGPSGSGKSSLASLLLRLYDPSKGTITASGRDLKDVNVKSYRAHVALVDQEPVLFAGSILDNIAAGITERDGLDEAEVRERCKQAAQDANADFISQLKDGLDSQISGTSLSGGQRQRLCLARALVRKPSFLVLDEPTSALDATSEAKILESLRNAAEAGCGIIMIAHRLATVKSLDNIIVIGEGSVLEQGSHEDLMRVDRGVYKSLVAAQRMDRSKTSQPSDSTEAVDTLKPYGIDHQQYQPESKAQDVEAGLAKYHAGKATDSKMSPHIEIPQHDKSSFGNGTIPSQKPTRIPVAGQAPGSVPGEILDPGDYVRSSANFDPCDKPTAASQCAINRPEKEMKFNSWKLMSRVIGLSKPETPLLVIGLVAAGIMGSIIIFEAIVFGNLITIINSEHEADYRQRIDFFCLMFFIISLIALVMSAASNSCFGLVSETLLTRIRDVSLRNMLSQDQAFFHVQKHSAHRLISAINSDSNFVAGLSGNIIATIFSVCFNIVSGLVVAIAYAWAIALVLLTIVPAIVLAGFLRVTMLTQFDKKHTDSFKQAAALASEAVQNIRTVAAFGQEHKVSLRYRTAIETPYRQNFWYCVWGDLALTLNYCIVYFTYALAYWWGSRLVRNGQFSERDFFTMLPAFLLTAQQSGQLFTAAPEIVQARSAAHRLFALLDEKPTIIQAPELSSSQTFLAREKNDSETTLAITPPEKSSSLETSPALSPTRQSLSADRCGAGVVFDNVSFSYPSQPDKRALRRINISVKPGQSVGIVGPSGAGKSSLIALLERFFDPTNGAVLMDGQDIRNPPVGDHRARLSLVSQEPSLFAGSIAFNIALGAAPGGPRPSQDEIEAVCRKVCMHDFITSLPDGYATSCGSGGSQLSGGQKQRIAIARALIRDPELLILDEATSALDSHSERQVQEAIAAASRGRTTVTVAHRLSTIQQADIIFCFDQGRVVEQGSHDTLVGLGGIYASMVKAQTLD